MLVAALFSFNQVFGDADYPGPAILGMFVASGIVIALRRLGLGSIVTGIISLLGLAWYLSLIFEAKETLWSFPTWASLQALVDSVIRAQGHSQIDFAPVPLRPGYAIMVVGALWIAVTLGEIATFRWRRPLVASALPLVLFVVSLVVGSGQGATFYVVLFLAALLTYWGLEASHRLRSWGRWVGAWSHLKEKEPRSLTGGMARGLGASCLLAAVISPVFLPALEDGLLSWKSGIGGGGGGTSGRVNPWASLQPQLVNQTDEVLFTVKADRAEYWRLISLENFDGVNWSEDSTERTPSVGGLIGGDFSPPTADSKPFTQEVVIEGLEGSALPGVLSPVQIRNLEDDSSEAAEAFSYDPESRSAFLADGFEADDRFEIQSALLDVSYEDLVSAEAGDLPDLYRRLPAPLSEDVQQLIALWTRGAKSDFEKLVAIQDELRNINNFEYTLEPNLPSPDSSGRDYLTSFLVDVKAGYCQQYAAAFAAIARHLGYPARVSVGFLPGDQDSITREFTVTGKDAHAWPEVYFDRYGWVRFEATPRVSASTPAYTEPPAEGLGPSVPSGVSGTAAEAIFNPEGPGGRGGRSFDDAPGGAPTPLNVDGAPAFPGVEGRPGEAVDKEWQKTFGRILTSLIVAVILFMVLIPGLKEWRTRQRYNSASGSDALAAAAFAEFQDEGADLASPRSPAESASAYAARMASAERVAERSAMRLAAIYEAAAFAGEDISPQQAEEARRLARRMRSQLWAKASWWERSVRLFSPRRLRAN
ncbi:MAG: transglutaminaseTgpA domain-containing protein [Actinomycetota bacterium]